MPELLIEVGCEELPASAVQRAYTDLRDALAKTFAEMGLLGAGEAVAMGTPRRLIVSFPEVAERQQDAVKEQRGPALKAAYDANGDPTPALLGFCRSNSISPNDLRRDEQYVWVDKKVEGRATRDLLPETLAQAIRGLSFDKTMRWGSSRMRFARPIRWLLASFGNEAVDFEIEGVRSSLASRGHRFYSPESFDASDLNTLLAGLRQRKVEPDPSVRRQTILKGAASAADGSPDLTEALVDENTFLTEWPTAIQGEFKHEYLQLPEAVVVTAMAKHEKMFPVRTESGVLTNRFVFVRNAGEDKTVRKGNEWVLNARLNDAKFFFDEDKKSTLDTFLEKTSGILFAEKLGSVRQRADRLASLSEAIAAATGGDKGEQILARTAGLYAKADLSSGLVSEFASLQGVIGGEYARREGQLAEVAWAISTQYDLSKNSEVDSAGGKTAVRLVMADQLDKLAGYLGVGLAPTGSSDPFGLRRAVTQLIEAAWSWPDVLLSYRELFKQAAQEFTKQGFELDAILAEAALAEIFASRYSTLLQEVRYDVLDAALVREVADEVTSPQRVRLRTRILESFADDNVFIQTATRPLNIISAARKKGVTFAKENALEALDLAALESSDGATLYTVLKGQADPLRDAVRDNDAPKVVNLVKHLAEPINQFFESTMVMAEEEDVRFARLSLMQATADQLLTAGDFSKLVVEG